MVGSGAGAGAGAGARAGGRCAADESAGVTGLRLILGYKYRYNGSGTVKRKNTSTGYIGLT